MTEALMSPPDAVRAIEQRAQRFETSCHDGVLVWRRWGSPRPKRRPVVLMHGGSGSWTHWIKILPGLSEQAEVWTVDLPGLGDSAMPPEPLTPESSGRVVATGVRELFDGWPIDLVAFSFGAHVGTYAAQMLGDRVGSFTISGAASMGLPHPLLEFPKERPNMSADERYALHRRTLEILMFKEPSRIDDLAVHLQAENIAKARFRSRAFATTDEIVRVLPQVTAPLAAIWGADDCLALPDLDTRYAVLRATHPELNTRTVRDAGHWAMYEQPEGFLTALNELLELRA